VRTHHHEKAWNNLKGAVEEKEEIKDDDEERPVEAAEEKAENKLEMRTAEEAERIRQQDVKLSIRARKKPVSRIKVSAKDLPIGTLGIVYAAEAQRLAKVIANRLVRTDPEPWIKVQLYGSYDVRGIYDRTYNPQWLLNGIEVIRRNRPPAHGESWVEIYAADFLFVLKYQLTDEHHIDPRDWVTLKGLYKDEVEIMKVRTVTSAEDNHKQRRKLRRIAGPSV